MGAQRGTGSGTGSALASSASSSSRICRFLTASLSVCTIFLSLVTIAFEIRPFLYFKTKIATEVGMLTAMFVLLFEMLPLVYRVAKWMRSKGRRRNHGDDKPQK
ncbi:hypothetical protein KEM54_002834, partial [Ascosphaera aggregata]